MSTASNATGNPLMDPLVILPEISPLDNTFGAMLLATFFGLILYGLSLHQTYRYIRLYSNDPRLLKTMVALIMILETVHSAMNMHTCYFYLVSNYFNPAILPQRGVWSITFLPLCASVIMVVSQILFVRRVYLIGANYRYIAVLAAILLAGTFGFGTAGAVEANLVVQFKDFYRLTWLVSVCFAMAASAEALITGALINMLYKSRTGFNGTDSLIDNLVIYTLNTGLLIGVSDVISLILAAALPGNLIYAAFNIITAKLHGNCLLAVLNSRKRLATRGLNVFIESTGKMNAIANAQRMATLEQWNVPQSAEPEQPSVITIKVTTERMGEFRADNEGSQMDSVDMDKAYAASV